MAENHKTCKRDQPTRYELKTEKKNAKEKAKEIDYVIPDSSYLYMKIISGIPKVYNDKGISG